MKRTILIILAAFFLITVKATAQGLASIVGSVTDPSGAAIPGASVVVTNSQKGIHMTLKTNAVGQYTAPNIPIGQYAVVVEAPGFQSSSRTGLTLSVEQTLRLNFQLKVGQALQTVNVNANALQVETETGAVSDVVTGSQVTQLNLNGRNFTNLATLIPGVAPLGGGYDSTTVGVLANATLPFNGVPGNFNNWEIDGTNNVDQGSGSNSLMVYPSIDSIAEFRVSTSNYSAEYGKSGGAQVEVVTKSGTDKFHGDMFEFVRNDSFDANDWFINRQIAPPEGHAPKTPLKRNDWGFTLGGPIYIPHHYNTNKNKTFFFLSEEWRRNREGTVVDSQVPSLLMRQGDFSQCDSTSANYNPVVASGCVLPTNPATGTNFPGNIVPIDPTSQAMLNGLIPLPNNGVDRYTSAPSLPTNFREDMIRVDENINDKMRIFGRYTQDAYTQDFIPTLWAPGQFGTVKTLWTSPAKSAVIHFTQMISPTIFNEALISFSADVNTVNNFTGFDSPAGSINKPSGFHVNTIFPANQDQPKLPGISVCGGVPFCIQQSTGYEFFFWDPQTALKDNATWIVGKHTLKFGAFLLDNHINTTTNIGYSVQGLYGFSDGSSVSTGNALADLYLSRVGSYEEYGKVVNGEIFGGAALGHWRQWDFEPYFEDDWRVSHHLTLNVGVRYYWLTPFHDVVRPTNDSIFVPSLYNPADEAQLDINGNFVAGSGATPLNYGNGLLECGAGQIPTGCYKSYHGTISPRFGFAWDPTGTGKTAVRGGYALTWDSGNPLQSGGGFNGNPPTAADLFAYNVVGYQNIATGPIGPASFSNLPLTQKWPEVQQFSLGFQHQFGANDLLSVSYVGTLGRHLQVTRNINQVLPDLGTLNVPVLAGTPGCDSVGNCNVQDILINNLQPNIFFVPFPGYTNIGQRELTGVSNYNSLQVNYRHTVSHGLTFQTSYTWSHVLDNIAYNGVNDYDLSRWYGTSSINQGQVLVLNYIYSLPFFSNSTGFMARNLLGGWELSGITSFSSGPPIDLQCGIAGLSSGVGGPVVCNSLGKVGVDKGTTNDPQFGPTPTWVDPGTIGQITMAQLAANGESGMFGYMGKNPITGPGRNNWDLALMKNFKAPWFSGDNSTVQFRWETFNTFNHPQWSGISLFCSGQTLPGQPCNGPNNIGNGEVSSAYSPRIMQFGLKFIF